MNTELTSATQMVEELIRQAEQTGVSDIHLQRAGSSADVQFRLDGMLAPGGRIPEDLAERVFGRIKYLARLKTYQDSMPQDGRIDHSDVGAACDVRVATYPTINGEKIVLRLFRESEAPRFDELGIPEPVTAGLIQFLAQSSGLLLLTGPAGSGKSTTIYACLRHLAEMGGRHVITIEDPVERTVPGIMQTEVNEARRLTFANAARHLLRHDPQVLVIGEVRDEETAEVMIRAAMTGHLVISTLHAGSCAGVVERLLLLCRDRHAVISAVDRVLNQRLIRKVCPDCLGAGCALCLRTGFRGRAPLVEVLKLTPEQRTLIRSEGPGVIQPDTTLREAALALVRSGVTTAGECERVLGP